MTDSIKIPTADLWFLTIAPLKKLMQATDTRWIPEMVIGLSHDSWDQNSIMASLTIPALFYSSVKCTAVHQNILIRIFWCTGALHR